MNQRLHSTANSIGLLLLAIGGLFALNDSASRNEIAVLEKQIELANTKIDDAYQRTDRKIERAFSGQVSINRPATPQWMIEQQIKEQTEAIRRGREHLEFQQRAFNAIADGDDKKVNDDDIAFVIELRDGKEVAVEVADDLVDLFQQVHYMRRFEPEPAPVPMKSIVEQSHFKSLLEKRLEKLIEEVEAGGGKLVQVYAPSDLVRIPASSADCGCYNQMLSRTPTIQAPNSHIKKTWTLK
jgi:hypothetical protein